MTHSTNGVKLKCQASSCFAVPERPEGGESIFDKTTSPRLTEASITLISLDGTMRTTHELPVLEETLNTLQRRATVAPERKYTALSPREKISAWLETLNLDVIMLST